MSQQQLSCFCIVVFLWNSYDPYLLYPGTYELFMVGDLSSMFLVKVRRDQDVMKWEMLLEGWKSKLELWEDDVLTFWRAGDDRIVKITLIIINLCNACIYGISCWIFTLDYMLWRVHRDAELFVFQCSLLASPFYVRQGRWGFGYSHGGVAPAVCIEVKC